MGTMTSHKKLQNQLDDDDTCIMGKTDQGCVPAIDTQYLNKYLRQFRLAIIFLRLMRFSVSFKPIASPFNP